jgi:hypothetical protein
MKYKLKIVPEGTQFIGYALENDEVVFQTNPCRDSIAASRELTKLIGGKQPVVFGSKQTNNIIKASSTPAPVSNQPSSTPPAPQPRKCCGRS